MCGGNGSGGNASNASNAANNNGNGGGGSTQLRVIDSAKVRTTSDADFWAEVSASLQLLVGADKGRSVVLNPAEFARMDPRGSQIVVTHELTHALTGVVGTTAPTWLVEGFADWVALHDDTAPLATSAGALLTQVAQSGAPEALPSDEDLAGPTSGAAYQGAWLSLVVLAREHGGDAAVLQVYRAVVGGTALADALASVGTSVEELTAQWRDYLVYSASTVS